MENAEIRALWREAREAGFPERLDLTCSCAQRRLDTTLWNEAERLLDAAEREEYLLTQLAAVAQRVGLAEQFHRDPIAIAMLGDEWHNEARERDAAMSALRSLTPGGSEYQTPGECRAYVRLRVSELMDQVRRFKRERDEAQREAVAQKERGDCVAENIRMFREDAEKAERERDEARELAKTHELNHESCLTLLEKARAEVAALRGLLGELPDELEEIAWRGGKLDTGDAMSAAEADFLREEVIPWMRAKVAAVRGEGE